jgi:ribosomal protein S24E
MLGDTEYAGTFSRIPVRWTQDALAVPTSAKRERGKVRGNKRNPAQSCRALGPCTVYASREAFDAGEASYTIERASTRTGGKRKAKEATVAAIRHDSHKIHASAVGNNSDAD